MTIFFCLSRNIYIYKCVARLLKDDIYRIIFFVPLMIVCEENLTCWMNFLSADLHICDYRTDAEDSCSQYSTTQKGITKGSV